MIQMSALATQVTGSSPLNALMGSLRLQHRTAMGNGSLSLNTATAAEYCRAALSMQHNEFWWYLNGTAAIRGYSAPFTDRGGRWWYQIKPGFAYPVDFFSPFDTAPRIAWSKAPLGFQYPVAHRSSNSFVFANVIGNLRNYGLSMLPGSKQRAVRRGMRCLAVGVVNPVDPIVAEEARQVWNKHVQRTGWNTPMQTQRFAAAWGELAQWPGTTVIAVREIGSVGALCSWLIVRTIAGTIYLDTLVSDSDYWSRRPNDTIIFTTLQAAARVGITQAHFSLKSALPGVERFKASLGFAGHPFPTHLSLRWPVGTVLRNAFPKYYRRLQGDPLWGEKVVHAARKAKVSGPDDYPLGRNGDRLCEEQEIQAFRCLLRRGRRPGWCRST